MKTGHLDSKELGRREGVLQALSAMESGWGSLDKDVVRDLLDRARQSRFDETFDLADMLARLSLEQQEAQLSAQDLDLFGEPNG